MSGLPTEQLQQYLQALEDAGSAIDTARRLRPHAGLDHAMDRLRWLMLDASRELMTAPPADATS